MNAETYKNGQVKNELRDGVFTYFFIDGTVKAQGPMVDGQMDGRWIFNKKQGYLWQVGHFERGIQHGEWTRFNADGSVESAKRFQHGKVVKG